MSAPVTARLTEIETARLAELEAIVERDQQAFVRVGMALLEIRGLRLYRESHATFGDYCRERWRMSRPHAYRLIGAAETMANLSPMGDIPLPATERVARELAGLSPDEQREIWTRAVENSETGNPTAAEVFGEAYQRLEIGSAWRDCQKAEKAGLELGRVCCEWRNRLRTQGDRNDKVFLQLCKKLKVPHQTACYWIEQWEQQND
jgi:hypothetical protein